MTHFMKAAFAVAALAALTNPAQAKAPAFSASCPTGIKVESDGQGHVRINGAAAAVSKLAQGAFEAKHGDVTIDITRDGNGVMVSYTGKHGANGICQVAMKSGANSSATDGSSQGGTTPSKDQQACLAAVSNQASNGDVAVLSTETSEANNMVVVGVGPQRAPWKCLVKNGSVAEVMSMVNEGSL